MRMLELEGVFVFIIPELNDIYSGIKFNLAWKNKVVENIINYEKEYLECIKYLMNLNREFPLENYLESFNKHFNLWDDEKNARIYSEIKNIWINRSDRNNKTNKKTLLK